MLVVNRERFRCLPLQRFRRKPTLILGRERDDLLPGGRRIRVTALPSSQYRQACKRVSAHMSAARGTRRQFVRVRRALDVASSLVHAAERELLAGIRRSIGAFLI